VLSANEESLATKNSSRPPSDQTVARGLDISWDKGGLGPLRRDVGSSTDPARDDMEATGEIIGDAFAGAREWASTKITKITFRIKITKH
jgi:hypothetical protein